MSVVAMLLIAMPCDGDTLDGILQECSEGQPDRRRERWLDRRQYLLEFERGGSFAPALRARLRRMRIIAQEDSLNRPPLLDDAAFESRLAQAEIRVEAIQITEHRVASALSAGQNPGPLSSMLKTQGTEMLQWIEELGLDVAAHYAPAGHVADDRCVNEPSIGTPQSRDAAACYFNSRAASIYGGANEIQRNIMARLVLGL